MEETAPSFIAAAVNIYGVRYEHFRRSLKIHKVR